MVSRDAVGALGPHWLIVLGVAVALFPSNYEIVGMNEDDDND